VVYSISALSLLLYDLKNSKDLCNQKPLQLTLGEFGFKYDGASITDSIPQMVIGFTYLECEGGQIQFACKLQIHVKDGARFPHTRTT